MGITTRLRHVHPLVVGMGAGALLALAGCSGSEEDTSPEPTDAPVSDADSDGYTTEQGDCNDLDASSHPGATEVCGDGTDQDCDGADQACPEDLDADGVSEADGDCNDLDASVFPGAEEICGDGKDQDCDNNDAQCEGDLDGDGVTELDGDCDDLDSSNFPGNDEICGDGADQDCDGEDVDCPEESDLDDDGVTEDDGDCNDLDGSVYPGASEICDDGKDQDCSGSDAPCPDPTPDPPPFEGEIKFLGLIDGDDLEISLDDLTASIDFEVENFTLKAPGECEIEDGPCGHVHLNIDGDEGNADGAPYNNAGASSPIEALFANVDDPTGTHRLTLSLVYDDHSPTGERASVDVNVVFPKPSITLVSPAADANVTLGNDKKVPVTISVDNFVLKAPGTCGGEANCGHIHLNVDGDAGNADGLPYNTAGASTSLTADFALLEENGFDPVGNHTIRVALHNDDHSPVEGEGVSDEVEIRTLYDGSPSLSITSPANGSVVQLGSDGMKSVPVTINLKNFTLKAPGTCGNIQSGCGHIHLHLDGSNGDAPGTPYNNAGASTTIDANFHWLDFNEFDSTGEHVISITLHNDDHSAAIVNGTAVEASTTVVTRANNNASITILSPDSGDLVALGTDENLSVDIRYLVTNFTLKAPGSCGSTANCGHIHAFIDGDEGNADDLPYNNAGADASTIPVYFSYVGNPFDEHQVTLELHKDDHSPVQYTNKDGSKTTAADWVTFYTE